MLKKAMQELATRENVMLEYEIPILDNDKLGYGVLGYGILCLFSPCYARLIQILRCYPMLQYALKEYAMLEYALCLRQPVMHRLCSARLY